MGVVAERPLLLIKAGLTEIHDECRRELEHPTLVESLSVAVGRWVEGKNPGPLGRWLARELDAEGVPRRLAIRDWPRCLEVLAGRGCGGSRPPGCEGPIAGFVLASL